MRFCFGDQPQCSPGFSCSVSGLRRHGHSTVPAILSGSIQTLFIFGGETTDVFAENPVLSSDLSIALFIQRRVDVARLPVTSSSGARCLYDGDCPAPRRDAALTVMGNSEDDNGYLILFGGMVEGGIRHHLDGEDKARGSDELWFAHLRGAFVDAEYEVHRHSRSMWSILNRVGAMCRPQGGMHNSASLSWCFCAMDEVGRAWRKADTKMGCGRDCKSVCRGATRGSNPPIMPSILHAIRVWITFDSQDTHSDRGARAADIARFLGAGWSDLPRI